MSAAQLLSELNDLRSAAQAISDRFGSTLTSIRGPMPESGASTSELRAAPPSGFLPAANDHAQEIGRTLSVIRAQLGELNEIFGEASEQGKVRRPSELSRSTRPVAAAPAYVASFGERSDG